MESIRRDIPPNASGSLNSSAAPEKERSIPMAIQGHHVREGDDLATPYRWARRDAGPRPPHGAARRRGAAGGESVPRRDLGRESLRSVGSAAVAGLPARPAGARLARRREPADRV